MIRILALVVWAFFCITAQATQANLGWHVTVDTSGSEATASTEPDSPLVNLRLNVDRGISTTNSFILKVYALPYLVRTNAEVSSQSLIHETTVDAPESSTFLTDISFTASVPGPDLLLSIAVDDEVSVASGDVFNVEGAVLARGNDGTWVIVPISQYDHQTNVAIMDEFETLLPGGIPVVNMPIMEPILPTEDEIQEPEVKDPTGPLPMTNNTGGMNGPGDGDRPGGDDPTKGGIGCGWCFRCKSLDGNHATDTCTSCKGVEKTYNGAGTHNTPSAGSPNADDAVYQHGYIIETCKEAHPIGPDSKPCDCLKVPVGAPSNHTIEKRQVVLFPGSATVRFTAPDRNHNQSPVRRYVGILSGDVYENDEIVDYGVAGQLTDGSGQAVFEFDLTAGQQIVINKAWVFLATQYAIIGSKAQKPDPLMAKLIPLDLDATKQFTISAGDSVSNTVTFPVSAFNQAFEVADVITTVGDVFRTQIVRRAEQAEQVNVWFPGETGGFLALYDKPIFINIAEDLWRSPSVIAHEYGHWAHHLARQKGPFLAGGSHKWCGDGSEKSNALAFSEGFASAFGLYAIDQSRHIDPGATYIAYQNNDGQVPSSVTYRPVNIEQFDCTTFGYNVEDRFLSNQEGRVAASIFDLVDRKLDAFGSQTTNLGRIGEDFDPGLLNWRWKPRFLFWDLIAGNPQSIEAYWNTMKGRLFPEDIPKASAIFDYNFAEFT